jgi:TetR/AcrR family transcriptional repressor of nem operon
MPRDGTGTRERILDAAQQMILDRGYAGMTLDQLLAKVGVTKGAFFYHFKTKEDLASALLQRFANSDAKVYEETRARAERLSSDPLQQMLVFIGLFEEMFASLTEPYPGCLFASYLYELQQFDEKTRKIIQKSFQRWRELLKEKFDAIARVYPSRIAVDTASLADAFTVVLEGAFITGKALNEPRVVADQLRHFRNYIELLFRSSLDPATV